MHNSIYILFIRLESLNYTRIMCKRPEFCYSEVFQVPDCEYNDTNIQGTPVGVLK